MPNQNGYTRKTFRFKPPRPEDEVPPDLCRRCGMRGCHASPSECIDSLRDRLADLELRGGRARREQSAATA